MKKLIALLLLFGIVGCEKEPSLLDKCLEANLSLFETTNTGDNLKIIFQPSIDEFNAYRVFSIKAADTTDNNWCFLDFIDVADCKNIQPEDLFTKYGKFFYDESKDFYKDLTVTKVTSLIDFKDEKPNKTIENKFHQGLIKDTYALNSRLICSEQGIY